MANVRVVVVDVVFIRTDPNGFNQYRIVDATGISYLTTPTAFVAQSTRDLRPGVMVDLQLNTYNQVISMGQPIDIPKFNPKGDV